MRNNLLLALCVLILGGCSGKYSDIPLEKRYWTVEDYETVIHKIRFQNDEEELPTFDNPETRLILEKLTDEQNFIVVLDDETLGVKYRNEVGSIFFDEWRSMNKIYWGMDRQDKYLYPLELIKCYNFGLGLQLRYFELGNDDMRENSLNPDDKDIKKTITRNVRTLIGNYNNYLSIVKNEDAFSEAAILAYADGLDTYFTQLIALYPKANFNETKSKLELLKEKTQSDEVDSSADKIITLIDSLIEKEGVVQE